MGHKGKRLNRGAIFRVGTLSMADVVRQMNLEEIQVDGCFCGRILSGEEVYALTRATTSAVTFANVRKIIGVDGSRKKTYEGVLARVRSWY